MISPKSYDNVINVHFPRVSLAIERANALIVYLYESAFFPPLASRILVQRNENSMAFLFIYDQNRAQCH